MLNEAAVTARMELAKEAGVPVVNYGIALAYMNGILERSLELLPEYLAMLGE
jgi:threonine/homoserine efflux transporter RhtA